MPLINIDLEDGLSKVSFTLMPGDAERFMAFMAECDSYKNQRLQLMAALRSIIIKAEASYNNQTEQLDVIADFARATIAKAEAA